MHLCILPAIFSPTLLHYLNEYFLHNALLEIIFILKLLLAITCNLEEVNN